MEFYELNDELKDHLKRIGTSINHIDKIFMTEDILISQIWYGCKDVYSLKNNTKI